MSVVISEPPEGSRKVRIIMVCYLFRKFSSAFEKRIEVLLRCQTSAYLIVKMDSGSQRLSLAV
jgi:hypothetical protein